MSKRGQNEGSIYQREDGRWCAQVNLGYVTFRGIEFVMHEYHHEGRRIWGATARMVYLLLELVGDQA